MMSRNGFSLLELSIVLVIIGLIAGGIVAGASMIRAAEIRAVITEQEQFKTATLTFKDKYLGLPGDLNNATAFWGAAHATPATCLTTAGSDTETCNGDGDGRIDAAAGADQYGEIFTFFQHLANAGLIAGNFTGISDTSNNDFTAGLNAADSKFGNNIWAIQSIDVSGYCGVNGYSNFVGSTQYNHLIVGADRVGVPFSATMTPAEAWNIDKKMDDGKPGLGKFKAFCVNSCSDVADAATSEYLLTDDSPQCAILIALD